MHPDIVDICVIEDDPTQRELLRRQLLRGQYTISLAENGIEGLRLIRLHHPRVVICDLMMPHVDGIELCRQVRADPCLEGTYFILITAHSSRENKHLALNVGADDFLTKPFDYDELAACVRNGMRVYRLQERLRRAALTDGLTGLWNHSHMRSLLDQEFARARRYGGSLSLLMVDLDHFKAVNDTFGHETGNRVLKSTARHLTQAVRESDVVARYGGEEFAIVCPQTALDEAVTLAERIRAALPQRVAISDLPQLTVTCSIGVVSTADPAVKTVNDLINRADQALYQAKRVGRDRVATAADLESTPPGQAVPPDELERLRKQVVSLSLQAKDLCLQSVWALVQALEARDPCTAQHSRNVTFFVNQLLEAGNWPDSERRTLCNAAMLHDLGKIGVPDRVIQKTGPLSGEEALLLRQVPLITCRILEPLRVFETEIVIIRHLRERYDGTGYPDGLKGANIPAGSRLLAIAEAFDAMTSDRAHRAHRSIEAAVTEIQVEAGRHFDPELADLLERAIRLKEDLWRERIESARREQVGFVLTA